MSTAKVTEISIFDHRLPYLSHNLYDVNFYGDVISTLVTHDPTQAAAWVAETIRLHAELRRGSGLIVGFDVEWRPNFSKDQNNPVAVIQVSVDRRCLVFQILRCVKERLGVPATLREFLGDPCATFVGVGIKSDAEKLEADYGMKVGNMVDLRNLAAGRYEERRLKKAGMRELAGRVLGKEMQKPKSVTMGKWDNRSLVAKQVQYACLDAFVGAQIATKLTVSFV